MLYTILEASAFRYPDHTALLTDNRTFTYRQLKRAADGLAGLLIRHGLKDGGVATLRLPNSAEFAAAFFAVSRCGAAAVLVDPVFKQEEAENYARRAGTDMMLQPAGTDRTDTAANAFSMFTVPGMAELADLEAPGASAPAASDGQVAVMLLSSGTSGAAKIVPKTAKQARAALDIYQRTVPYRAEDRVLAALPFNHSFGFFNVFLAGIAAGATLVITKYSPRQTADLIAQERISVLPATPFMFRMMAETEFDPAPDFSAVRVAVSAGAALPATVLEKTREKFGISIWQSYGTTESGPAALERQAGTGNMPLGCVGTPYADVTIRILGPDGKPLPEGAEGEVAVYSGACTDAYLDEPEASYCFRDGGVLTGDVGRIDPETGVLVISGRRKRMINVAGKKVSPDEVEACLLTHPGVVDALVTGDPTPTGEERVIAYVVAKSELASNDIRTHCAERLADFKVPRLIRLVSELKRGPMGKVPASERPSQKQTV